MLSLLTKYLLLIVFAWLTVNSIAVADTPIELSQSYAGNINYVGTQATRRTQSNAGNSCSVLGTNTTNTAVITGIPNTATIREAHLYWAGSYSTQTGSTRTTPDYTVTFEGGTVTAPVNRRYTANYATNTLNLDFFSGVADVTAQVNTKRNGSYSFSGLTVNTATQHCDSASVLNGWSLIIIYEDANEDFRVINLYEGFRAFRGQTFTLTPDNFRIPASPINGKHAHITWEGDAENSGVLNGFTERLVFNGSTLTDGANPANNQFNSTSTISSLAPSTGTNDANSYGIDFDIYDISALLTAGDTTATSTYNSGADLILLSSEIISVTNTPVSDLSISKSASSTFSVGNNATYTIVVNNAGPSEEPGNIVVTDTLPAGLTFVSGTGTAWNCTAAGQDVTCTRTGSLASGANAAPITLTVAVSNPALPSVTNTASVTGTNFDNISANNSNSDTVTVTNGTPTTLAVGQCDNFENGLGNWVVNTRNPGTAEITNATAQSPTQSLDLYEGRINVRSIVIDTSNNFKELTMWVRRGATPFSDNPENNENLRVQYRNPSNTSWVTLETFLGSGTPGQIYNRTYLMPADAKHSNFRIRFQMTNGSTGQDHWHIDDVCLVDDTVTALPTINLQKTSLTLSDPINGTTNPKAIPGALAQYVIKATNSGSGAADNDTITISDAIPANTALFVNDVSGAGTGPIRFIDGAPPSGLSYNFSGLGNTTDGLSFSNNNGASYTYVPSPDAEGVDTSVTNIRISTLGQFLASGGSGNPSFTLLFRVKVQ